MSRANQEQLQLARIDGDGNAHTGWAELGAAAQQPCTRGRGCCGPHGEARQTSRQLADLRTDEVGSIIAGLEQRGCLVEVLPGGCDLVLTSLTHGPVQQGSSAGIESLALG